jgi:Bacterial Ig domain/Bacterial Ig-like domain (group 1)
MPEGRARLPACNMLSSSRSGSGDYAGRGVHSWPRADVTKPYRTRLALPIAILLAALTMSCGGDVTLPDEGEAAELRIVDGNEQHGAAGAALGDPVIVLVLDTEGRPVPSQDVDFVIADGGGAVEPETVTTGTDGRASATWTLGAGAGVQHLRARTPRGGSTTMLEVEFTATAIAGSGSVLVEVSGDEQRGPVNSALADSLVVRTTDALGNPVANVEVTWSVSGGGSISPVTVLTDTDGLAAAERVLGPTAGAQSAQATVSQFAGSITFTHTAEPANPTALVLISGNGQSAPAGFEVPADLVVRLQDPSGNGIGSRAITWVVPSGSGSVSPVSVQTDPNGLASTRWRLPNVVGQYTVSAVFSGLDPVVFTATANSDAPTMIEMVSGNGQSASVGTAVANPLVVRVTDANDNPVANVAVAWTAVDGGSVSADNSATDAQGLAQVTRTLGLLPGQYTTTAAVDGLQGSPVTFVSTATVGPPAQLAITQQPGSPTVSGSQFEPPPVIQVQDAQGNPVPQGGIPIVVTITSGQPGATLENESRNTNLSGRVTFSTLQISGPPDDDYILTFTANFQGAQLTPVSTGPLAVIAGGATRLLLTQQPSATAQSGVPLAQAPVVQVVDATGNPVAGSRTIEVEIGDGTGTLEGAVAVSTNGGSTATFSDLAISGTVGSRTLLFSSGALTPVESNPINLTTGPAASISIQAGNNQTAQVGTTLPTDPAVIIRDSGGNPVGGVDVTFAIASGGGSVSPTPVTTGSNGIAATNWTLGSTAGGNSLDATSSVGTVTFNATGTAQGTTTTLTVEPQSPTTSGTPVTFTATVSSGGGTPSGTVSFRDNGVEIGSGALNGSGVATFQTSTLTVEQHSFTAFYPGGGSFGSSQSEPVSYEVTASNAAPVANPDNFSVSEDGTLNQLAPGILANDTDADGDVLTAQGMGTPPSNGELAFGSDGSFSYTPDPDFSGSDQFSYRANDGQASSATVAVTLTVNPVNDDPVFTPGGDVAVNIVEALAFSDQWATGIDPGPPNESTQALDFAVTLVNPADSDAFLVPPQISDDGTLTFAAAQLSLTESRVIPLSVLLTDNQGGSAGPVGLNLTITPLGP